MRHNGVISKSFIFVFHNESLFNADCRTFYCKRKYSSSVARYSTHTDQVVKGMKQFRAVIH
jgi:hypothetical protein